MVDFTKHAHGRGTESAEALTTQFTQTIESMQKQTDSRQQPAWKKRTNRLDDEVGREQHHRAALLAFVRQQQTHVARCVRVRERQSENENGEKSRDQQADYSRSRQDFRQGRQDEGTRTVE